MPFKPRELYPKQYFHIIIQSNNHAYLFKENQDFQKILSLLHHYFTENKVKIFHYVVMNTHLHCLVQMPDYVECFSEVIKIILLKYYYYYKYKYGWDGSLWRKRYKAELIDADRYMLGCGLYIEHNPVKAGIVKYPEEYKWSSYGHWIGKRKDGLLSEHPLDVVKNYREISEDYMNAYVEYVKFSSVPLGRPRNN